MAGYTNQDDYWANSSGYDYNDTSNFGQHTELNFQDTSNYQNLSNVPFEPQKSYYNEEMYNSGNSFQPQSDEDEPPLLEELGIDPDRIMEKTLAVLNPFHKQNLVDDAVFLTRDNDLAGPLVFCLALGGSSLLSGGKANFGYVYGLAVTGCLAMYSLFSLMSSAGVVTLTSVASILGYCLLPVVVLSVVSIFVTLKGTIGIAVAVIVVAWCSLSASRLFVTTMQSNSSQRALVAYPCMLFYGVFVLLVVL